MLERIVGVAFAALLVTACSGGSNTIAKSSFVEQGNAICTKSNAALSAAVKALGSAPPDEQVAVYIKDTFVPNIRGQIRDLRALGYPKGDKDTLEGAYTAAEEVLVTVAADPASFVDATKDPFAKAKKVLTDYGLTICGQ
jgi:hypothetical protein